MKTHLIHGILAGGIAAIASMIYNYMYESAFWVDFSLVVKPINITIASVIGTLLASLGYVLTKKLIKRKVDAIFNLLFVVLSCVSFVGPLAAELPLEVDSPELFAGLVIPMHLFPALAWMAIKPFFEK